MNHTHTKMPVTKDDIEAAYEVLKHVVKHTPLEKDLYLSQKYQCNVYLKREDLQWVRSFKLRGAYYAVSQLTPAVRQQGISCASAGNHAQGVAYTANKLDLHAVIFMPVTTPNQKIEQVKFFGQDNVEIKLYGDTFDECLAAALQYTEDHNLSFIDPFDNNHTVAGQGTVAKEIFMDQPVIDYCFQAVGGGGLISGVGTYLKDVSKETQIIAVEPRGASSMKQSLEKGTRLTLDAIDKFVDGAAVATVGALTFDIARQVIDDCIAIDEGQVCSTIIDMYTKQAIVAEPAGALSVSALEHFKDHIIGKNVVCIISGGNNDINRMNEIEERALLYESLKHYFIVNFPQRPGALKTFVNDVLGPEDDITKFEYLKKTARSKGAVIIGVQLKDKSDENSLYQRVQQFDPKYIAVNNNEMLYSLLI